MRGTLAIDLGSSTTVVAWLPSGGEPSLLPLAPYALGEPPVVPSLVWLPAPESTWPLIGRQVLDAGLAGHGGPSSTATSNAASATRAPSTTPRC